MKKPPKPNLFVEKVNQGTNPYLFFATARSESGNEFPCLVITREAVEEQGVEITTRKSEDGNPEKDVVEIHAPPALLISILGDAYMSGTKTVCFLRELIRAIQPNDTEILIIFKNKTMTPEQRAAHGLQDDDSPVPPSPNPGGEPPLAPE